MAPPRTSIETRVAARLDKRGPDDCWPWKGRPRSGGYGVVKVGGHPGIEVQVHRFMLERALGRPLTLDMCALHKCDNRKCANPAHLFEGTKGQNNTDREKKGRSNKNRDALGRYVSVGC